MARTMAAAAHNPDFAARVGIKQSVAREFNAADKRRGLLHGVHRAASKTRPRKAS